jgi:guanylate kinase
MKARVVCIIGVSGAGKTSVVERLMTMYPDRYRTPISATTRPQREGEQDGRDYHFLTRDEFERRIADGLFVEHAIYNGNYYGTPLSELQVPEMIALHVVEDDGAVALRQRVDALVVGIVPPSDEERERRMRERGDSEESVAQRVKADAERNDTVREIADIVIVNDDLTVAADVLVQHVQAQLVTPASSRPID